MTTFVLVACVTAVIVGGLAAIALFLHANPRRVK